MVDQATESWGVKITRVELRDIRPPQDIVNAMTRQMKAEREKRAVILEAEGMRQSAILKAEGEKQSAILSAEGAREAAFREAEARERAAQAEANGDEAVSDAIEGGSAQAINYFIAQKYVEAVAEFARSPNAKTILFPVEATQLIGTLGGIGELAKEAVGRIGSRDTPKAKAGAQRPQSRRMSDLPIDPEWLWLIGGVVLLIAELIAPGFFLIFIGAAAIVTGFAALAAADRRARFSSRCSRCLRSLPRASAAVGPIRCATIIRPTRCSTIAPQRLLGQGRGRDPAGRRARRPSARRRQRMVGARRTCRTRRSRPDRRRRGQLPQGRAGARPPAALKAFAPAPRG